ncbi:MAG: ABC transporter permease subunit, partial [Candidatus Promineifilaceae bacterium]
MTKDNLKRALQIGLILGVVAMSVCAIGMVQTFNERDIITGVLTLGQLLLFSLPVIGGYLVVPKQPPAEQAEAEEQQTSEIRVPAGVQAVLLGAFVGFLVALVLLSLVALSVAWPDARDSLPNFSPALIEIITFGQDSLITGGLIMVAVMLGLGVVGTVFHLLPQKVQRPIGIGVAWTLGIGLLSEIILIILLNFFDKADLNAIFGVKGIKPITAAVIFTLAVVVTIVWDSRGRSSFQRRRAAMTERQTKLSRQVGIIVGILALLALPLPLGPYLTEVLDTVGIFVIMGIGLNIVVGFAGLLDLGYVAFFAIGAYTMALLTSTGELGVAGISFWMAVPFCILAAAVAGIILGVPVLRMRGDYLAIVTLGFGEIIRVLVGSDLMKVTLGGAQGILSIGRTELPIPGFLL